MALARLLNLQSDERLGRLSAAGSQAAFAVLAERYRRTLYAVALRVVPVADAEDCVQAGLLSCWRALAHGTDVRHVSAWMHRVTRNAGLEMAAAAARTDPLEAAELVAPGPTPEERRQLSEALAAIAALPRPQRIALIETAVQGRAAADVAHDLGTTAGTVRQLTHRARLAVRHAATAITPLPLAHWIAAAPAGVPATEAAGAASLALTAKVAALVLATGGTVGGAVAISADRGDGTPATATSTGPAVRATPAADLLPEASALTTPAGRAAAPAHRNRVSGRDEGGERGGRHDASGGTQGGREPDDRTRTGRDDAAPGATGRGSSGRDGDDAGQGAARGRGGRTPRDPARRSRPAMTDGIGSSARRPERPGRGGSGSSRGAPDGRSPDRDRDRSGADRPASSKDSGARGVADGAEPLTAADEVTRRGRSGDDPDRPR